MVIEINELRFNLDFPSHFRVKPIDIYDIETVVYNCLKNIIETNSIRSVILETWLISEFFVRLFLTNAFEMSQYKCDNIDPRYDLLPSSFNACINMLEKLLNEQRKLPIKTEKESVIWNVEFHTHLKKNYPEVFNNMMEILIKYEKRDLFSNNNTKMYFGPFQNEGWVKSLEHIDAKWFKFVRKINKIRNSAAHNIEPQLIYKELGTCGKNEFAQSKEKCLEQIYKMFYISVVDK